MRENKKLLRESKPKPPTFAVIGDGECEFWYFQMLKRNERSLQVTIKPDIPQKKKLKDLFDRVMEYSKDYDKVFWVVDLDVIVSESRLVAKGKESPLQEFRKYVNKIEKKTKNVTIILNNPCLEFWLLLHFEATSKYFDNCNDVTKRLRKHLPNYEKTENYYTKQNDDIYLKLKSKLNIAIENADKLINPAIEFLKFDLDSPETAVSQMQFIFQTKGIIDITHKR